MIYNNNLVEKVLIPIWFIQN